MTAEKNGARRAQRPPVASGELTTPMRRQTMGVQVHALLRREIITGQLLPRTMLSEQELSQRFGTSRTPVREALIKLSEENLVATYPQYASFVAPISLSDVFDSQFVREAIECAAVERAVERIDPAQAKALSATLDRQRLMHRAGDEDGFFQADEGMHAQIIAIAGHANAWRTVENAKAQLDRVRYLNLRTTKKQQLVLAEHGEIIDRLIARDAPGAVAAMRVHLRGLFHSVEILRSENAGYFNEDTNLASPPSRTKGVAAQAAGIQPMTDGGQQQT